jgi:hypothetical protein
MKQIVLFFAFFSLIFACNTKQGTGEPPLDNRYNPAEMTVDSVGANTDMRDNAATDSNKTGEGQSSPGISDNDAGGQNNTGKAVGADGNIISTEKDSANKK